MDLKKHLNPDGHQHLFKSGVNMALMLNINQYSNVYKTILERRKLFGLKGVPNEHPHLTLHMINFNYKHPFVNKGFLKEMKHFTKACYNEILYGYKLLSNEEYAILGKIHDPTFVIKYKLNYPNRITKFRICLYNKIAELIGIGNHKDFKRSFVHKVQNDKQIFVYFTPDGMPLYGIHEHYHGNSGWEPHISLFKLKEKQLSSTMEIGKSFFKTNNYSKINRNNLSMVKPIKGIPKLKLDDLILNEYNFSNIKVSTIGAVKEIEYTGAKRKRKRSKRKKNYKRTKPKRFKKRSRKSKKRKRSRRR